MSDEKDMNARPPDDAPRISREWNELRCIAHDIILQLHAANQQTQIALLLMACTLAQEDLKGKPL